MKSLKFLLLFIGFSVNNFAQENVAIYRYGFDTNYVVRYNDRLAISIYQSQRTFDLGFKQTIFEDTSFSSALNYIARSNKVTGINIAYDKISFAIGITTPVKESEIAKKGKTKYYDYNISFTSYRYRIEAGIRQYTGFYEGNTANYDTTYTSASPFFQKPGMYNLLAKIKYFYFFNKHKFSYGAVYNNTYRQLKTAGTTFVYGDGFYNSIYDATSVFPNQIENYYGQFAKFNYLQAYGITAGVGYSLNLVLLKSLYVNGTVGLASQFYQQNIGTTNNANQSRTFKAGISAADIRGAIGYNGKNFYIRATVQFDITNYKFSKIILTNNLISGSFAYGYRFKFRERNWMKNIKNTKLYKAL